MEPKGRVGSCRGVERGRREEGLPPGDWCEEKEKDLENCEGVKGREYLGVHKVKMHCLHTQNHQRINKIYATKMDRSEMKQIFLGGSMLRSRWKFSFNLAHTTSVTAHFQLFIFIPSLS